MKIKLFYYIIIVFLLTFSACNSEKKIEQNTTIDYHKEFKKYAADYLLALKAVLVRNLKNGGPLKAVTVCSDTAQALTKMFSDAIGLKVKRVSFKNRNPNDAPDVVEAEILKKYEKMHKNNKLTSDTETFGKYTVNGKKIIRYMKPIIVEKKCLICHGNINTKIKKNIKEFLKKKYPHDKAVNYSAGDLRGAISITKEM